MKIQDPSIRAALVEIASGVSRLMHAFIALNTDQVFPAVEAVTTTLPAEPEATAPKKSPGRPKKEKAPVAAAQATSAAEISPEEVHAAFAKCAEAIGLDKAKALLQGEPYKLVKLRDLPAELRPEVKALLERTAKEAKDDEAFQ